MMVAKRPCHPGEARMILDVTRALIRALILRSKALGKAQVFARVFARIILDVIRVLILPKTNQNPDDITSCLRASFEAARGASVSPRNI
jgi:hypothetical protein